MKSEPEKSNLNDMTNIFDAESDLFDLFENPADAINDDTEPEDNLILGKQKECKTGTTLPIPIADTGVGENVPPMAIQTTGYYAPHFWMPWLQYPVTAQGMFDLALTVDFVDPARQQLGFFYETQLKHECKILVPHPIPSFYPHGILKALMLRRSNPGFFVCYAIDIVLTRYLRELNGGNSNDIF